MAIHIPVIDISSPSQEVAKRLLDAACTHGFVYIANSDNAAQIPPKDVESMFDLVGQPLLKYSCTYLNSNLTSPKHFSNLQTPSRLSALIKRTKIKAGWACSGKC